MAAASKRARKAKKARAASSPPPEFADADVPWARRPDESPRAYEAFCVYLMLGPRRSLLTAYRQDSGNSAARAAPGGWTAWQARFNWTERAAQHDAAELQRMITDRLDSRERARQCIHDRLPELVEKLVRIALGEAIQMLPGVNGEPVPVHASMVEVVALKHALALAGLVEVKEVAGAGGGPVKVERVPLSKDMSLEDIDAAIASRLG